jgi:hypothetical protein
MKTFTRISVLVLALCLYGVHTIAGEKGTNPVSFRLKAFVNSSVQFMSGNAMNADRLIGKLRSGKNTARICVCEVMQLANNNDAYDQVALMSEKTNNGDLSADYKTATGLLSNEKKHMKEFFFDVLKVTRRISAPVDCVTLYLQLRSGTADMKMYDILDADIVRAK